MKSISVYNTILLFGAILMIIAGSLCIAQNMENDISILESSAQNLTLEYKPVFLQQKTIPSSEGDFTEIIIENNAPSNLREAGAPKLLARKLFFGLPSLMKPTIEIVALEYEDVSGLNLVPVPTWSVNEDLPVPTYNPSTGYYSKNIFYPENIVTVSAPYVMGGCSVAELKVASYQYNPSSKTVRKISRIVVKINFPEMKSVANGKPVSSSLADVLVNYNLAREWKMISQKTSSTVRTNSVLASGNWWTTEISSDGIYKITGAVLFQNGIPHNTINTIKVFNNGGFEIPDNPSLVSDNGDLKENAIFVVDKNSNGNFEDEDYILFYGKGVNGWKYNASTKSFSHTLHHYAERNTYFISYGATMGKRMAPLPLLSASPATTVGSVTAKIFREEEKINGLQSGRQWLGELFNSGDELNVNLDLPGVKQGTPLQYRFSLAARADDPSVFKISEHNTLFLTAALDPVNTSNVYGDFCNIKTFSANASSLSVIGQSSLNLLFTTSAGGSGYLDWIEIMYERETKAKNDIFNFHSVDTNGVLEYSVTDFSSNDIRAFDVSDFENVQTVTPLSVNNNSIQFKVQANAGVPKEIFISGSNGYRTVTALKKISNQNLHGDTNGVRYVIVTHPDFFEQAIRLGNYRQSTAKRTLKSKVVTLQQIYNEFSSGVPDVGAVRNYAKYLFEASDSTQRLKYLLLFGDGDFDFKRIIASGPNWVPPWETENSFGDPIESYAGDDFFGSYSLQYKLDVGVGRLCVRSSQDAENVVDKIIEYETHPVRNGWNNKIIYIADDFQEEGTLHNDQADDLAQFKTPLLFEKVKLYSAEFQAIGTSLGRRKPSMNDAIVNEWNKGALIINYTGHGNPRVWTHEQVFTRESSIPRITNKGKYPFLIAATCNFAQFDNVGTQSSAEILMNKKASGVIGIFAATRAVYAFSNAQLNQYVYEELFTADQSGKIIPKRLGDVTRLAKYRMWTDDNQRRFYLLSDPALEIAIPREYAIVDSINNAPITATSPKILMALSKPVIHSTMIDNTGTSLGNFTENGFITVFDSYRDVTIRELVETTWYSLTYRKIGSSLFRGAIAFHNGTATSHFIVPKDITYDTSYNARIGLYFWNNETDGAGVSEYIRVGGTDSTAGNDITGPTVFAYLNKQSFRSGDVVSENPILYIELSDSNGINTSSAGIGHQLEARLDNTPQNIDLSAYYRSEVNDFRKGKVEYRLSGVSAGEHRLLVRAWDTYNNATEMSFEFRIESDERLSLRDVYNYPNPFSRETYFTFLHNQTSPINVEVKIYTVSGRLIQSLRNENIHDSFVRVHWDGRDYDGNEIANGLYLYKIVAKTTDKKFTSESLGKLSIIR